MSDDPFRSLETSQVLYATVGIGGNLLNLAENF